MRILLLWLIILTTIHVPCLVLGLVAPTTEQRVVCGRPCLIVHGSSSTASEDERYHYRYPTLVVLGGIAQTTASWEHQMPSLSRNRKVIVYECLGQGKGSDEETAADDDFAADDVSLPFQAKLLLKALDELVEDPNELVDIAGFSFGGRVALTAASINSGRFRRLHLTGVGCDRSDYGHLAMDSFQDVIQSDPSLRSFAWAILLATYSPKYLRQLSNDMRERFLSHISTNNSPDGLLAILQQAEVRDESDPCHVKNMGEKVGKTNIITKLCVGELDLMAPVDQVQLLGEKLGSQGVDVIPGCGHAVAVEGARAWKNSLVTFLNEQ